MHVGAIDFSSERCMLLPIEEATMADNLVKALKKAKYTALPLPRAKSGPTTIFTFTRGKIHPVRDPHKCLPDPPVEVTVDPSADLLTFSRTFSMGLSAVLDFLGSVFGLAGAKANLDVKRVHSATVQLGGLAHWTVETGAMVDYILDLPDNSSCLRDLTWKDNLTVVAALKAETFTYTFHNQSGEVVKFSAAEASRLFKTEASVAIEAAEDGSICVKSPTFVGIIVWDGKRMKEERKRAREFRQRPPVSFAPGQPRFPAGYLVARAISPAAVGTRLSKTGPTPGRGRARGASLRR